MTTRTETSRVLRLLFLAVGFVTTSYLGEPVLGPGAGAERQLATNDNWRS